jgi:ketosteroid isomerase-like protein
MRCIGVRMEAVGRWTIVMIRALLLVAVAVAGVRAQSNPELREQVRRAEVAFAKTMADRDYAAFQTFLDPETIFFNAGKGVRGAKMVAEQWKRFYDGPQAPFSWEPEVVEVLDSGTLGLSSGPVKDPSGKRVGTFNSVWRRNAAGQWKVVLDNGCPRCECTPEK